MRAAFYQGARTFTTGEMVEPTPGHDEALLRVRRVGICGMDLHIFQGHLDHRVPKGGVIGHETFGEVVQASGPSGFTRGDRVVVEPAVCCGSCDACRMGTSHLCYQPKVLGVDLPGGMREYWAVSTSRLVRVPDSIADDHAALIEPLAVAVHDVNRADVKRADTVLVSGGGPIGTLIALVARHRGARVAVVELDPFRLEILEPYGFECLGRGTDVAKWTAQWTDGTGVDIAFEVTGNPVAARAVAEVVRVWGTVSIVAIHAEPVPASLYRMFAHKLVMRDNRLYTRTDWEEAIRLVASGAVPVAPLVSRRIPLESLQRGMEEALGGGPVMKVLVEV